MTIPQIDEALDNNNDLTETDSIYLINEKRF